MKDNSLYKLGGIASVLVGITFVVTGITGVIIPSKLDIQSPAGERIPETNMKLSRLNISRREAQS